MDFDDWDDTFFDDGIDDEPPVRNTRYLQDGEIVKYGDMFTSDNGKTWDGVHCIGKPYNAKRDFPIIRPLELENFS
jgi:hypothetical protein